MLKRALLAAFCAFGIIVSACAGLPHGGASGPVLPFPLSYYATFANGSPATASFFPVGVWYQIPNSTTGYSGSHPTLAAALMSMGINFVNYVPTPWPTSFGVDNGELAAAKAAGLRLGSGLVDWNSNSTPTSVPSIQALIASQSANQTVFSYNLGDELGCGTIDTVVASGVAGVHTYDTTRQIASNFTGQVVDNSCPQQPAAAQALSINSFDLYPVVSPFGQQVCLNQLGSTGIQSDFISIPNDCIWAEGIGVQNLISYSPNKPVWVIIEAGSDVLASNQVTTFASSVTSGTNVIVNRDAGTGYTGTKFTSAWVGLTVTDNVCLGGTVLSVADATHLTVSGAPAACSNLTGSAVISGGANGGGCLANNLCLPHGNEYRGTPQQINSEAWNAIISGAFGITWFCHDAASVSFCLGAAAGGAAATAAQANLDYIDATLATYAVQLNTPGVGACSMQHTDFTVVSTCTNGVLTMATGTSTVPGLAMLKSVGGVYYLFAMSDRRSAAGAIMTFTITGAAGKVATVVYDSNSQYDSANNNLGATFTLNGSAQFSDTFGAHNDHYQVRIYRIP